MRVLRNPILPHGFMFFPVLLLAFALAPAASTGPQPELTCGSCDDHSVCTIDSCDSTTGFCRHDPAVVCDDANPCTADSCNAINGCRFDARPVGTACDDANSCSAGDICTGTPRVCTGSLLAPGTSCDDRNACTHSESCTAEGQCLGTQLSPGSGCDDQNACTSADSCVESPAGSGNVTCQGTLQTCDDGDPCTQDACDPASGICGAAPRNCNDGNACTLDACNVAAGGCVHTAQSGDCDDGIFCSVGEFCSSGRCIGGFTNPCDDHIACTDDFCTSTPAPPHCQNTPLDSRCPPSTACFSWTCFVFFGSGGCAGAPLTGNPCSDNNPCTAGDVCNHGTCQGGTPLNCNDGNACTTDSCTGTSCAHSDITCSDQNACTTDTCDPATGNCANPPITGQITCGQGACQRTVECVNGAPQTCVPGTPSPETCNGIDDDCDGSVDDIAPVTCGAGACQRTVEACLNGVPQTCVPGIPSPEACNGIDDDCNGSVDDIAPVTCGVGACQRTVAACVNGVPQTCLPGAPSPEVCSNHIDDDCNGQVDEGCGLTVNCVPNPATLSLSSQGGMISVTCQFPISGLAASQVYVSRLDSADTTSDDVILPDPSTLPCPDPVLGTLYERGISENMTIRGVSDPYVTFKFNLPSDGDCSTLDGDRQDFAARLTAIPDNTSATVCISGTLDGQNFEGCMLMKVLNKGPR